MTKYNRHTIRKSGEDYSTPNIYFITLCTQHKQYLFGTINKRKIYLNDIGEIVAEEWEKTSIIRNGIQLKEWIIMPNHLHALITINYQSEQANNNFSAEQKEGDRRVAPTGPKPNSIGSIIAGFKSASTKRVNELRKTPRRKIWQRNYWDHIIRNRDENDRIRKYIINSPELWESDKLNNGEKNIIKDNIPEYKTGSFISIM